MKKLIRMTVALIAMLVMAVAVCSFSSSAADEQKWISAWGTAPTEIGLKDYGDIGVYIGSVTVRTVITPTASGDQLRLRLTNAYGKEPLTITKTFVAKSLGDSKIDVGSSKVVTFNEGKQSVTIPAGGEIFSDPINYKVTAQEDLAVSMYVDEFQDIRTMGLSGADSYLTINDASLAEDFNILNGFIDDQEMIINIITKILGTNFELGLEYSFIKVVPILATLEVSGKSSDYSVVVVGDSTVANEFPLYLSQAIYEGEGNYNVGIVGKGIIGNQLLHEGMGYGSLIFGESMLDRFQRDVLSQNGLKYVVVKIGCNDIVHPVCNDIQAQYPGIQQPTAEDIIEGFRKIFQMCHDADVKVIAVSITQWKGNQRAYLGTEPKYIRTDEEFAADWQIAKDVNEWLKNTKEHDGFVDFTSLSRNLTDPDALAPEYTIDGVHPSNKLQQVWAEYFPKSLIGIGSDPYGVTLNKKSVSLVKNDDDKDSVKLKATVAPSSAGNKAVKWYSENEKVAKVDSKGNVIAVGNGTTTIVCETKFQSGDMVLSDNKQNIYYGFLARCEVTVSTKAEKLSLDKTSATIYNTKTVSLKASFTPSDTSNKGITWKSSNTDVATVSSKGVVTGKSKGTATITAYSKENPDIKKTCKVTVNQKKEVTYIDISKTKTTLTIGKTRTLTATVEPSNATFKDVVWSSSNSKVASVDQNGKVTAHKVGKAVISCKSTDNPLVVAKCTVSVVIKVTGVKLNSTSVSMYATSTKTLKATVSPSDATDKDVTWKSSNTKIVTVSSSGKLTAVKAGTAYVTVTTDDGDFTAKCKVTVTPQIKSTGVKLNKTSISIKDDHTYDLKATVSPSNTSNKSVKWSSSDTKVAKVSSDGVVTAVKPGTATITCTTKDTGKKATCKVTVKAVVPSTVYFSSESTTVTVGKTKQLNAIILPTNATNKNLKWKSSNSSYVSVDKNGKVKGLKVGKSATITVTTESGNKVAKIKVTVVPVKVKSVKLDRTTLTLSKNHTKTLVATVSPSNAGNKAVTWKSTNTKVIKVDSKGKVTAVGNGTAYVICTTKDGGYTAKCKITVKTYKITGLSISETLLSLKKGDTAKLEAIIANANASNKKVTWESSNEKVATVSSKGKVTAVGKGTCTIKIKATDGSEWVATCRVVVS